MLLIDPTFITACICTGVFVIMAQFYWLMAGSVVSLRDVFIRLTSYNTSQQNLTFFFVPRTSIGELSSTFYAELRYVYRFFLSGRVSKIQRNLHVQNSTLRAHETGRNFPLKCWGVWLLPVFGIRYMPLQCPAVFCQHKWGLLALVPLFHSHNVLVKSFTVLSLTLPRFSGKKSKCDSRKWIFRLILHPVAGVQSQQVLHNILIVCCFVIS